MPARGCQRDHPCVMHGLCTIFTVDKNIVNFLKKHFADRRSAEKIGEVFGTEQPPVKRPKLTDGGAPGQHLSVPGGSTVVEVKLGPMPEGQETLRKRKLYLAPSQKLHYPDFPLKIVRGRGQYFFDENDKKYLDTTNNVAHVGHCHPKVVEACSSQMAILNTNSRFLNDQIVTYAKNLTEKLPKKLTCCFFTNSGSEANDLALQIAQTVTGSKHVIAMEGAYHGHLTLLKQISSHRLGAGDPERANSHISIVPLPDTYRGEHRNDETAGKLYAVEVSKVMESLKAQGTGVAAFIHEAMPCCAGQIVPPKDYYRKVYKTIHEAGGLCITDEIQTGFGRIGEHFWAFEYYDVTPDIVTMGKSMGNGHPVAAVVTTREIAEKFAGSGVEYFNTFGGNPVSMAISNAVLSVIEDEGLQSNSQELGNHLKSGLEGLKEKYSCIGDVRGTGLFLGVDFVKDCESREPDKELAEKFVKRMLLNHKIIVLADGVHGNVIKFKPPMVIARKDCDHIIRAMDSVLKKLM